MITLPDLFLLTLQTEVLLSFCTICTCEHQPKAYEHNSVVIGIVLLSITSSLDFVWIWYALITMVPVLRKFPTSFSRLVKDFCFQLASCENIHSLVTLNEVFESVDGLQIRVNLADPKIKNSVVIVFDSNAINPRRMIFQKPKKNSKYHFLFKSCSNLKYLRIFNRFLVIQ